MSAADGNGPLPVWRCERCSYWQSRNGETRCKCPYCRSGWNALGQSGHRILMTEAFRVEPAPDEASDTWAEEL